MGRGVDGQCSGRGMNQAFETETSMIRYGPNSEAPLDGPGPEAPAGTGLNGHDNPSHRGPHVTLQSFPIALQSFPIAPRLSPFNSQGLHE